MSDSPTNAVVPTFRKRGTANRGAIRKRKREQEEEEAKKDVTDGEDADDSVADDDDDEFGGEELSLKERMEITRIRQQRRTRSKGVTTEQLKGFEGTGENSDDEEDEFAQSIGKSFAHETKEVAENKHMLEYIEKNMNKDKTAEAAKEKKRSEEDELFITPEHLKAEGMDEDEEKGDQSALISEVDLSIDYKLKNIEATEKARRDMSNRRGRGGRGRGRGRGGNSTGNPNIPTNMSTNFRFRGPGTGGNARGGSDRGEEV
eukprot:TRINITY_DN238_c0_g3_i1.p1 TRINITY_DN238_c0_g3~~TRINITY_DN238_c0_g3_i1.p1  ORF type:complete len:260 (+),score=84.92 TRINITY_DN238_c0_g3_i1:157-936(+)